MVLKLYKYLSYVTLSTIFLILLIVLPFSDNVGAETNSSVVSWSANMPVVISTSEATGISSGDCSGINRIVQISIESEFKNICLTQGDLVSFGHYYTGSGSAFQSVVGFKFDAKMYKVEGICTQRDDCLYLPGTDTLVTKQYLINGIVRSLVIYKNFSTRLSPVKIPGLTWSMRYKFDASNPDYIFQSSSGYAWPIGGFGTSKNGEWLAIEVRERGIGLLNINSLQMRRISPLRFYYGWGMNPSTELTVDNYGEHIAVGGMNAGLSIFDIDQQCGEEASDTTLNRIDYMLNTCKQARINTETFITRFSNAFQPRFNDDGSELNFFATSYDSSSKQVSLRASGYEGYKLEYLAMGDSFTSGEGDLDDNFYMNGTNDEYAKCHLSTRSYPYLLTGLSNINPDFMRSVACSGATIKDVVGDESKYIGQGDRMDVNSMNLSSTEMLLIKNQASANFIPGFVRQEKFAEKYKPQIITVGIGGNDAGFMTKLKGCISPGTCDLAGTDKGRWQTATEIKNLFPKLVNTYQSIHKDSPNSKIYAIGYPRVIDKSGECGLPLQLALNHDEREFMEEGITYLNDVIAAAAKSAGIKYIDITDSYGNGVLCGSHPTKAMNSLVIGDDSNGLNNWQFGRFIGNESFHPNQLGHLLTASYIYRLYGNISTLNYCDNGLIICPEPSIQAPEPSSYWDYLNNNQYTNSVFSEFIYDDTKSDDLLSKTVRLSKGSLLPNSIVKLEIHSDNVILGEHTSNNDGSIEFDVQLPDYLDDGYHTAHIFGLSFSNEPIEIYQIVDYKETPTSSSPTATTDINHDISMAVPSDTDNKIIAKIGAIDDSPTNIAGYSDLTEKYDSSESEVMGLSTTTLASSRTTVPIPSSNDISLLIFAIPFILIIVYGIINKLVATIRG